MWRLLLILAALVAATIVGEAITSDEGVRFLIGEGAAIGTGVALYPVWFGWREARPGEDPARPTLRLRRRR